MKDVTADENLGKTFDSLKMLIRANLVRAVVNHPDPAESLKAVGLTAESLKAIGLTEVDWDRIRENDRKYSKTLKRFIPSEFYKNQIMPKFFLCKIALICAIALMPTTHGLSSEDGCLNLASLAKLAAEDHAARMVIAP